MIVPRRRPTRFDRHMNDYLKKLSILPSDVGRRDGVVFAVARGGAGAGVDFVGWVERLANIWGGAVSGWRSICRWLSLWPSPLWPSGSFWRRPPIRRNTSPTTRVSFSASPLSPTGDGSELTSARDGARVQ